MIGSIFSQFTETLSILGRIFFVSVNCEENSCDRINIISSVDLMIQIN